MSKLLDERGIDHQVLNAKEHEREAAVVAEAGRQGAVTVATNMAGRGTDILLGGNYEKLREAALKKYGAESEETAEEWQLHAADAEARYITDREGYAVRVLGGCASSAPSATRRGASTTSCAAAPGARGTGRVHAMTRPHQRACSLSAAK